MMVIRSGIRTGICSAAFLWVALGFAEVEFKNPDFETIGADGKVVGWYVPPGWQVHRGAGMNGSSGLVFECQESAGCTGVPQQRLALEPGGVYRFNAWVKVDDISDGGRAGLVIGWRDANGRYLGETQSPVLCRKGDWTKIEALTRPIATNAAAAYLQLLVKPGTRGRIIYDKVLVERHVRCPVVGIYCAAYRNEAVSGDVAFAAALTPEAFGTAAERTSVRFEVMRPDQTAFVVSGTRPSADEARTVISAERFAYGTNVVTCVLQGEGREIGRAAMMFVRPPTPTSRRVSIDAHGRILVDGQPFFPLGMYTSPMSKEHLARYREAPFNCLMQYGSPTSEQMQSFRAAGLKVIYDIASQYGAADKGTNHVRWAVNKFKQHPSLLAWYLYDEQPTARIPVLEARQRLVESLDSDHPTWCAQDIFSETRHYLGACDVFGGDPYPVSAKPIALATEAIRTETKGLMGMRPIWQVVQAFGWNWIQDSQANRQRRPTEAEIRNMAWQALAGGARGLIFYSYGYLCRDMPRRDPVEVLWPELVRIAREIKDHERMLLAVDTEPVPDADLPPGVVGRIWRVDGETWRVLVNTKNEPVTAMGCGLSALGVKIDHL